eukprot:CAMPEP_0177595732 /NCGR_PEP_ID=MMETSP0419_2-20121207/10545_1 /TAXON_ID=582737 /ORGANISM="Tetraselmis sp., Strain GSL018" /LENGTH=248 /DNA_ID=CAMNT_0019087275 /DNA_START=130 /DNA_END=874 /DNA_ORIENTATION=-
MSSQNPDSFGKIRVLVAGNSGSGKTSVSHLIATGRKPRGDVAPTVGCQVHVRLYEFEEPSGARHKYFVELWDVGAHRRYEPLRKTFYGKINGVILVHDIAGGGAPAALQRWAMEIADQGTFSAELAPEAAADNLGALPVPVLVLYNKADKLQRTAAPAGGGPDLQHGVAGLRVSALRGDIDAAAVDSFFSDLVKRRYHSGKLQDTSAPRETRPTPLPRHHMAPRHSSSNRDSADFDIRGIEGRLDASS